MVRNYTSLFLSYNGCTNYLSYQCLKGYLKCYNELGRGY